MRKTEFIGFRTTFEDRQALATIRQALGVDTDSAAIRHLIRHVEVAPARIQLKNNRRDAHVSEAHSIMAVVA